MPPRDPALYLADIVEAARAIEGFLVGRSLHDFTEDDLLASAVHSKLIIIGEAAASLPVETRDAIPEVDWGAIVRFRNLVVHAYFVMNLERVYAIATQDVPALDASVLEYFRRNTHSSLKPSSKVAPDDGYAPYARCGTGRRCRSARAR